MAANNDGRTLAGITRRQVVAGGLAAGAAVLAAGSGLAAPRPAKAEGDAPSQVILTMTTGSEPAAGFDPRLWSNIRTFAHLYSCTIVKNTAGDAGVGIWFNNNVRVNSSVVWSNYGNNSANVCGQTDPYSTTAETKTSIFYPFTYSAIENLRAPGMNNISVHTEESKGVRFDLTPADPYYYLRHYSVLARAGMEV